MSTMQPIVAIEQYVLGCEIDELRDMSRGVSVVIPCFGQVETLHRAVDSAVNQTESPSEVIVIDDGTPGDDVLNALDQYVNPSAVPIRYVKVTNRGLAAARNTGLMLAHGAAFLPLDADDWLDLQFIQMTMPLLQNAEVVLTGIQEHGPTRNGTYKPGFDRHFSEVTADLILNDYNRFYYAALIRTDFLRSIGGYNPKMTRGLEDADLWTDCLRRGARFAAVDEPLLHYSTNPDGMLQTIHRDGGYEEMVAEMRRHHGQS